MAIPVIDLGTATDGSGDLIASGSVLTFVAKETVGTVLKGTTVSRTMADGADTIDLWKGTYTVYFTDVATGIKQIIGSIAVNTADAVLTTLLEIYPLSE